MREKTWIIVIVAFICGFAFLDNFFPKADPINHLNIENIATISLFENNKSSVIIESADFEEFLQYISNAKPTRRMSVNDYPSANSYYTLQVDTPVREYRYFIYTDNSEVYIELPYEGVYKTNYQFLDFVEEYFKK